MIQALLRFLIGAIIIGVVAYLALLLVGLIPMIVAVEQVIRVVVIAFAVIAVLVLAYRTLAPLVDI